MRAQMQAASPSFLSVFPLSGRGVRGGSLFFGYVYDAGRRTHWAGAESSLYLWNPMAGPCPSALLATKPGASCLPV